MYGETSEDYKKVMLIYRDKVAKNLGKRKREKVISSQTDFVEMQDYYMVK
jgi:hypothetical protein